MSSCSKQSGCTDYTSANYDPEAVNDDGSCIAVNRKFVGIWNVESGCEEMPFFRNITPQFNDQFGVYIANIAGSSSVLARIAEDNITIRPQNLGAFILIEGAGKVLEDGRMELSYKITDTGTGSTQTYYCFETMQLVQ